MNWTFIFVISLWLVAFVGWIMNIVAIIAADFSNLTGLLVARVIGVFIPPLGSVLGFFS